MMGAVLFGYMVRLGLIFLRRLPVRDAGWISLAGLGATIIVTHLGLLIWELRYVSVSLAYPGLKPSPRLKPRPAARRYSMFALEFPPINEVIRWQDIFPTFNKVALIACARRGDRHRDLPVGVPQGPAGRPPACATWPRPSSTSSRTRSSCRRWARRAWRGRRSCCRCSSSSTSATCQASSRSFQMPATARMAIPLFLALVVWVIYNVVGFKHQGFRYITGIVVAARRAVGAVPAGRRHRVHLDLHRPALLPGRPTLRQHARRPHAARDVRLPDRRHVHRRDEAGSC